ncbi:monofunctional biosynthetic peptidoglycan transglycosylase [Lutimaribacter marinistellae]|uniref:Biosynthetic peptidoglycan transglycosylase n=1 Tax=Lutimaribacter marinistellae TaxID=1820329 RepID=A0ABV7TBP5_9RHOB
MARAAKKTSGKAKPAKGRRRGVLGWLGFLALRSMTILIVGVMLLVLLFAVVNPPVTHTMWKAYSMYGPLERDWVPAEEMAPVMLRSVVAAEDANFCLHWGFDVAAIRAAIDEGSNRGASTLSQQTVKNVFLWQGRSWVRKALETAITPAVEAVWTKRRILEVYLNVAEMGEGVFGVEAAAQKAFGVSAAELTPTQAARLAAVLPNPKERSAANPSNFVRKRAASIMDGAATIRADGRAACFED